MKARLALGGLGFLAALALGVWGGKRWASSSEPPAPPPGAAAPGAPAAAQVSAAVVKADAAIARLDLDEAERLLRGATGRGAARTRALLLVNRADCEGALELLRASSTRSAEGAEDLFKYAERCAGATTSGFVVEDEERGVWMRLQDRADEALAPLIFDAVVSSREVIEKDLGTTLPRPLRIDLVRDLFSLSAVSGLPLEAAETTGTVAVARFSRVTMLSPRATYRGYPWQDTVAHEITHLVLARASADRAPLWLQEGVAKREETRWRAARPFDRTPEPSLRAYRAEQSGQAVGVDKLGPSIAMLPSADAAGIAFAEVTSFIEYWIAQNGLAALPALLADLRVAPDADAALRSTSGYGLLDWQRLWRADLRRRFSEPAESREPEALVGQEVSPRELARASRLVELLFLEGHPEAARARGAPELDRAPHSASLGFFVGRAAFAAGDEDRGLLLRPLSTLSEAHGGFLALVGRAAREGVPAAEVSVGDPVSVSGPSAAESADPSAFFSHALALDPLLAEVACEGVPWHRGSSSTPAASELPERADRRELCRHVRDLPLRGAE